jgi:hypothetical protein
MQINDTLEMLLKRMSFHHNASFSERKRHKKHNERKRKIQE